MRPLPRTRVELWIESHDGIDPRAILARYLPAPVVVTRDRRGKPGVAADALASRLWFSVARTAGASLCAVTAVAEVGVDLERVRPLPDLQQVADQLFAPVERRALVASGYDLDQFYRYWTLKEAYLKAVGIGIGDGVDQVAIELTDGGEARLIGDTDGAWQLVSFDPAPGYRAAVAVRGRARIERPRAAGRRLDGFERSDPTPW